jgi:hypothetical protein
MADRMEPGSQIWHQAVKYLTKLTVPIGFNYIYSFIFLDEILDLICAWKSPQS